MATVPSLGRVLAGTIRRRLPLTSGLTLLILVVGIATGALWAPLENQPLGNAVGYGLPSLHAGHWWTLLTGAFFADQPIAYVPLLLALLLLGGLAEWQLGTRRVMMAGLAAHLVGVGGALSLLAFTAGRDWAWANGLANHTDLGLTTAIVGAAAAASATLSPAWRLRLRVLLVGYVVLSLSIDGNLADVEHALGVAVGLGIGRSLVSSSSVRPGRLATHADRRLMAAVILVAAASVNLLVASQRWSLLIQDTGSAATRAETVGALRYGGVLLVPLLLIAAGVCVWRGGRVGWWTAIGLLVLVTVTRIMPMRDLAMRGLLWWPMAILAMVLDLAVIGAVVGLVARRRRRDQDGEPQRLALLDRAGEREMVRNRLRDLGSTNRLAWMTTWPQNRWFHAAGVDGHLAYRSHARVALGLCDPVAGHEGDQTVVLREFADRAHERGLIPCVFAASSGTTQTAVRLGWQAVQIAEEAVVELPGLEFRGKAWQDVRTALNQGCRRGITVVMGRLAEQPAEVRRQVAEISHGWTAGKKLPELGFTLGGLVEAADPEVRVAIAIDQEGLVHGVTSWLPSHGPDDDAVIGWTLDVMRRRGDGFRGVMELLIAGSLTTFRDEGYAWASLSASPLAHTNATEAGSVALDTVLQRLSAQLEPFYGFRSLHAFKAKFQPRFEPLYLVYPDDIALPRISVALTRAYLPGMRVRDLFALGQGQFAAWRRARVLSTAAAAAAASREA